MSGDRGQSVSVVIPAFNAERTLGAVLEALAADPERPDEVIVVDDRSTDRTAEIALAHGARVVEGTSVGYAGGARNRSWDSATGDVVVFLDADAVPLPGFGAGVRRAAREFPGAIVGCARRFAPTPPGRGLRTCRSRRPTWSGDGRATCASCPPTACSSRAPWSSASTRATAARTPSSARTRSRAAFVSSSTPATRRCTTTTATRSRSCAGSSRAPPSPQRASAPCSARG